MKKMVYGLLISCILSIQAFQPTFATLAGTRNDLHIIPETQYETSDLNQMVKDISNKPGKVIDTYNDQATTLANKGDLGAAFATGIFNRDTILLYIAYLVQFLSQLGMLIGGVMMIYAGYKYATNIFGIGSPSDAKTAIINAVKGILVISFSYAILKILTSMFIS